MRIVNKYILSKLAYKNKGNTKLIKTIQELINDIEESDWKTPLDLQNSRPDADCVYGGTFYSSTSAFTGLWFSLNLKKMEKQLLFGQAVMMMITK